MEEFISNFHFLRPWYLLLLILSALFYWRYFKGLKNKSSWEGICDKKLLDFLLIKGSSKQRKAIAYLAFVGIVGIVLAISGPSWQKREIPSLTPENPVMLLLNLSTDMAQKDLTPNRLTRAKFEISDLLKLLHNVQAGLIVYSSEPFLISPITDDLKLLENLLPAIEFNIMPSNGDRLDRAIALAIEKFKNARYSNGNIIIFTSDIGERFDLALEEAKKAQSENYTISVVAVTADDAEKLKLIAQNGGGIFTNINANDQDIEKIAAEISKNINDELKLSENLRSTWEDYGYYLIIIPLLCCLYFFRKGIAVIILLMSSFSQAQAGFFINNNQEGLKAYNNQDYTTAVQKFEDAKWKAAALYKAGDYEKALQEFGKVSDLTALYNQGNALAKAGKTEEAIKKYEEVLKLDEKHEDAKFNLEYLKQQQEEQQQQQDQQQNQNQEQNSEQKQDQQQSQQSDQEQNKDQQDNADNQQNQDQKEQKQSPSEQDENENKNEEKEKGEKQQQEMSQQEQEAQKQEQQAEEEKKAAAELQKGDEETKYDEEVQAREQQYRDIPEDTGGLLRAFIEKEYMKNRYKD